MALPSWPAGLPELRGHVQTGGTDALYRAPLVTEFDDGPARVRRRGFFNSVALAMTLDLDMTTLPMFQAFVQDTLGDGARRFTGLVLLPNGAMGSRTCRIQGAVALKWIGPFNPQVSFPLTVWNWRA